MEKISKEALAAAFGEMLDSEGGTDTLREAGTQYVRQKMREESFVRKILPAEKVTKHDLQRNVKNDSLEKIVDLEPNSMAVAVNFRSDTIEQFVEGSRYAIAFHNITTPVYHKTEEELLAYEMPVVEIIERNSVKDVQAAEDRQFVKYIAAALKRSNQWHSVASAAAGNAAYTGAMTSGRFLTRAIRVLEQNNQLVADKLLMSKSTYTDLLGLGTEQLGDVLRSEVFQNGYMTGTLFGKQFIVTLKEDLVPYGAIIAFTSPDYMGNFYVLGNTKFWIEKKANLISWRTWETVGLGIGNIKAIGALFWNDAQTSTLFGLPAHASIATASMTSSVSVY
jgi:hypothetical protein